MELGWPFWVKLLVVESTDCIELKTCDYCLSGDAEVLHLSIAEIQKIFVVCCIEVVHGPRLSFLCLKGLGTLLLMPSFLVIC